MRKGRAGLDGTADIASELFGVSYPTIKNRLNRLSQALGLGMGIEAEPASPSRIEILDRLERGEITPQEAMEAMEK